MAGTHCRLLLDLLRPFRDGHCRFLLPRMKQRALYQPRPSRPVTNLVTQRWRPQQRQPHHPTGQRPLLAGQWRQAQGGGGGRRGTAAAGVVPTGTGENREKEDAAHGCCSRVEEGRARGEEENNGKS